MATNPKGTGKTKKYREDIGVWQDFMHAMMSYQQMGVYLANLHRRLFELEEETTPATPKPDVPSDRPSQKPTAYHTAVTGPVLTSAFMDRMKRFWNDARTAEDRHKVIELVRRGFETETISKEQHDELIASFT